MAFTTIDIVRKHLTEIHQDSDRVRNLLMVFGTDDRIVLPNKGVKVSSEKIKGKELSHPVSEEIVFNGESVSLGKSEIVPESVVVGKDESLTEIYRENVDFSVDYENGKITRIGSGMIEESQKVNVWYYHYKIYVKDTDYIINYSSGSVERIAEGDIESGQMVWIDYDVVSGVITDTMLGQAIEEAHVVIAGNIRPEYVESSDKALEVAETYFALAILSRMKSLEVLQSNFIGMSNKKSMAEQYLKLGGSYTLEADKLLQPYLKSKTSLVKPVIIRNRNN